MKKNWQGETAATMAAVIGKRGRFRYTTLSFDIEINDVRQNFGRVDYFVKPLSGRGEGWVSADSVTVE